MDADGAVRAVQTYVRNLEQIGQLDGLRIVLSAKVPQKVRALPELTDLCARAARSGAQLQKTPSADAPTSGDASSFEVRLVEGAHTTVVYEPGVLTATFAVASVDAPQTKNERAAEHAAMSAHSVDEPVGGDGVGDRLGASVYALPAQFWQIVAVLTALAAVCIVIAMAMRSTRRRTESGPDAAHQSYPYVPRPPLFHAPFVGPRMDPYSPAAAPGMLPPASMHGGWGVDYGHVYGRG